MKFRFLMTKTQPSRLSQAILETADGMRRIGIMNDAAHERITHRFIGKQSVETVDAGDAELLEFMGNAVADIDDWTA